MKAWRLALSAVAVAMVVGHSLEGRAALLLNVSDGSHSGSASDGGTGVVQYQGTIGNFTTTINSGAGFPAVGSPSLPVLDLTSLDLTTGTTGGTLTISLTETGFTATTTEVGFLNSITGNYFGSSAVMDTYFDPSDTPYGTAHTLASGLVDNQSAIVTVPPIEGPYSLTEIITVTAGANSLTSIDAAVGVPEPGSLSLLGAALLALGLLSVRKFARIGTIARPVIA